MKVIHVINTLQAGGAELHLLTLCRHLKAAGIGLVVVCLKRVHDASRGLTPDFEREGIEVFHLEADKRSDWSYLLRAQRLIKEGKPHLVHTHLPRADLVGATMAVAGSRVPWISSVHGIYSESWSGWWALPVFDFAWRRADRLVAISGAVETWLVQERRQRADRVDVVHYGIDIDPFVRVTYDLRHELGLGERLVIGTVGRLEAGKGHDVLIRAMPRLLEAHPGAMLLIVGHDTWGYGKVLQALIDELHLGEAVRLLGFRADIPAFLNTLNVFAFASHSEGFGQVVVEAMAAGKPVVVKNKAPMTEIVRDGVDGRLVSGDTPAAWARAVSECLAGPAEAAGLGMNARRRVEDRFNARRMAARTLALYREVLEMQRRG